MGYKWKEKYTATGALRKALQYLLFYGLILLIIRSKVKENGPLTHTVESQIRIGACKEKKLKE